MVNHPSTRPPDARAGRGGGRAWTCTKTRKFRDAPPRFGRMFRGGRPSTRVSTHDGDGRERDGPAPAPRARTGHRLTCPRTRDPHTSHMSLFIYLSAARGVVHRPAERRTRRARRARTATAPTACGVVARPGPPALALRPLALAAAGAAAPGPRQQKPAVCDATNGYTNSTHNTLITIIPP